MFRIMACPYCGELLVFETEKAYCPNCQIEIDIDEV